MAQSEKIIISVELKDKGVKSGLKDTTSSIDQATNATQNLANAEKDEAYWATEAGQAEALRSVKTNIAKGEAKALALETIKLTDATKKGKTQTGLNNAILTEAGRTASDAAYGMQGMANNLGQLLTLMSQHVKTKGGFIASMSELGKSLFGIGGILIGLQLLISYLPQIQKFFEDAADSASKFLKSINENTESLRLIATQLSDQNITIEKRNSLLAILKRTNKELYDLMVQDGELNKDASQRILTYIELQEQQNRLKEKQSKLSEEITRIEKDDFKVKRKLRNIENKHLAEKERAQETVNRLQENGIALTEEYTEYVLTNEGTIKVQKQRAITEEEYWINFSRRQRNEKALVTDEITALNRKKDQLARGVLESQIRITKLRKEVGLDVPPPAPRPLIPLPEPKAIKGAVMGIGELDAEVLNLNKTTADSPLFKLLSLGEDLQDYQKTANAIGGLAQGFIDTEIQAEEAKTVKLNNQLKERLSNENLSADERKKIQAKIAANDMALAKKKNKLAEKQFKIDKALAISTTLINTFESAVKAYRSQLTADPTSPFRAIIAGAKASAFGLAKVAMIAKQKFVPSAISAPSVGGDTGGGGGIGGGSPQAPSFNIVGSSGVNQLSDAISAQGRKPVRTYVVASDVSTAQELDRNIIESASL
jgi:hypothetical protein